MGKQSRNVWQKWSKNRIPKILCLQAPYIETLLWKAGFISFYPEVIADGSMPGEHMYWRKHYHNHYDAGGYIKSSQNIIRSSQNIRREKIKNLSNQTLISISPYIRTRKEGECAVIGDGVTNSFLVNVSGFKVLDILKNYSPITVEDLSKKAGIPSENILPFIKWLLIFGLAL